MTLKINRRVFLFGLLFTLLFIPVIKALDFNETFETGSDQEILMSNMVYMGFNNSEWQYPASNHYISGTQGDWWYGYFFARAGQGINISDWWNGYNLGRSIRNIKQSNGNNQYSYIMLDFESFREMTNNTNISFYLNSTAGTSNLAIFFINDSGCPYYFNSGHGVDYAMGGMLDTICNNGNIGYNHDSCIPSVVGGVDESFYNFNLKDACGVVDITQPFNKIAVYWGNTASIGYYWSDLDNFALTDYNLYFDLNNSLPTCEFNINNSIACYNTSDMQNISRELYINCNDTEGDTIHYGLQMGNINQRDLQYEEDFFIYTHSQCSQDYDIFDSDRLFSNHTGVGSNTENALWFLRLDDEKQNIFYQPEFSSCNALLVTPEGVDWFRLDLEDTFNSNSTTDMFFGFEFNETNLSIIPRQNNNQLIFNATFSQAADGTLSIYIDGTEIYSKVQDNFNYDEFSPLINLNYYINPTTDTIEINIITADDILDEYIVNRSVGSYSYIDFYTQDLGKTVNDGDYWVLNRVFITGSNFEETPTFSTTIPSIQDFEYMGNYEVRLYVSDSYHQPIEYRTYTESMSILSKCPTGYEEGQSDDNMFKDIGGIFELLFRDIGIYDELVSILWMAFFVFWIFLFIMVQEFRVVTFISTLFFMIFSWLIGYSAGLISFIVLFALSIVLLVLS